MSDALLNKLDELIAATNRAGRDEWLDLNGVADMLKYSAEHTRHRIVVAPDFPAPARPNGSGHPRWLASEVHAWMQSQVRSN